MISTADKILSAWQGWKQEGNGRYRGNCPYRSGSDSNGFVLKIDDGEHGAFTDHSGNNAGSLYELADLMNIERPINGAIPVESTKVVITDMTDYDKRHFVPEGTYEAAGWKLDTLYNRPILTWHVQTGKRGRYLDKPEFTWIGKNSGNCWYGLDRAIRKAYESALPLVLCNGEPSVVAAQYHGIPAFAGCGGEGAISDEMLAELNKKWNGQIVVALDCDEKGQIASKKVSEVLPNSVVINLGLSDKGDLADFCGLHAKHNPMQALKNLMGNKRKENEEIQTEFIEFVSSNALLATFTDFIFDKPELFGRVIEMPYSSLRQAGGFAELMTTKKVWLIGNVSGGGKTILSESLCDEWNRLGYNVFYIGDEWTPMELVARQVQRSYRGKDPVSYMDYLRYVKGQRTITDNELESIAWTIRDIRSRKGQTFYMKVSDDFNNVVYLDDIMASAARKIDMLKANGQSVDIVILDYLSLYETRSTANNVEEFKVGLFKSYCKSLDVLGVTTVQVKKDAEDRVISKGGFLTQHDLYWVRADKGNLISTMNRVYRVDGARDYKPYLDENGQPQPTPNISIITAKNSVASPFEYSYFHFDFNRMKICEGLHPDYELWQGMVMEKDNIVDVSDFVGDKV